ncbi:MAG: 5'/3'-nucleotidase SurE [Spirochaetia bacterium]|nr:5'/3'-nucleotidase SurE [Spirochaetia bacterium]
MKKRYYVLISNDDGINSAGLAAAYEAVSELAEVLIVAPDRERSGASHSLSVTGPLKAEKVRYKGNTAYAVSGTPVDCVKLGLLRLARRKPDLVISGVNHGPNISQFILYSGTIGAATEAAILGIPAMAFSIDTYTPGPMEFAVKYIRYLAGLALDGKLKLKKHTVLNVNLPNLPEEKIRGVKIVPKGMKDYNETYKSEGGGKHNGGYYWHIIGPGKNSAKMTDSRGVAGGYVTVTPLLFDLNDRAAMKGLSKVLLNKNNIKT